MNWKPNMSSKSTLMIKKIGLIFISMVFPTLQGQLNNEMTHDRGLIWENVVNDGFIGSLGAWDYGVSMPLGMYPGFADYVHPVGGEQKAVNTFVNANFHNFRSGVWIITRDLKVPGTDDSPVPVDFETFLSGTQMSNTYTAEEVRAPLVIDKNYTEEMDFDPFLPEEMITAKWNTNTGISVSRRSYQWSFPAYDDFIIYDYIFKNTGQIVSNYTAQVVPGFPEQDLEEVWFVFHSGISVSTKSQINFHSDVFGIMAGGFGWEQETYHDYYNLDKFDGSRFTSSSTGAGELAYSTNYNGGHAPHPNDPKPLKDSIEWVAKFGQELMSPSAFGWVSLYADPRGSSPRSHYRPDVLRIDSHKGGIFKGKDLDLEKFALPGKSKQDFYEFATTSDLQDGLGNKGDRMNFYTFSYGPYNIPHGDSIRIIVAEIAGVMDYEYAIQGDPDGFFPDSTIAAIRANAVNAINAVKWGIGTEANGIPLAADVPEPPPSPVTNAANNSVGTTVPQVAVTWDDVAEQTLYLDGAGNVFYDGSTDLDGYRIYRSTDFQFTNDTEPPVLRGATWKLLKEIPKDRFGDYWDDELGLYKYSDDSVAFNFRYGYYVAAFTKDPGPWTSANGTVVSDLGELEGGSHNRSRPTSAVAGPVDNFDIYVIPNPYIFNEPMYNYGTTDPYKIVFNNLPLKCTIRIYTLSGDLVRTLIHEPDDIGNVSGSEVWDQETDSGLLVAPGMYIYHVSSDTEGLNKKLTGKLMIIR